jgi:serine protease AprX
MSVLVTASVAVAGSGNGNDQGGLGSSLGNAKLKTYVPSTLLSAVQQNPKQTFDVIVQGDRSEKSGKVIQRILQDQSGNNNEDVQGDDVKDEFQALSGGEMSLSGWQILHIAKKGLVTSISSNESVKLQGARLPLWNDQLWPWATGAPVDWTSRAPDAGTIAIVDSGIETGRVDFGNRVIGQVNLASLLPNSPGDGYGHGTFVAGVAAGAGPNFAGAAPRAELLSIDVMNDQGQATVADVVRACDFILANKATYNIKVANFSLHAVNRASILFDPLDAAVEKLWLNGVVVVTASGNYGTPGKPSGVGFAPGNDPFVITVGAVDIGDSVSTIDDSVAPWSAYGYTGDGFSKPEIGGPGRYMVAPVPVGSVLPKLKPENVQEPGYMRLSGTSFAAPVVAAAAAMLVAQHPDWTPDQIKGALMVTASPEPGIAGNAVGVGNVNLAKARILRTLPPNPNAGLNQFVTTALDGTRTFDSAAWQKTALANKLWNAAAWSDAAWSSAAWSSAAWGSVAWADAAWASAAWGSAAWSSVAWSDVAWADAAWADNTGLEPGGTAAPAATPAEQDALLLALGLLDPVPDPLAPLGPLAPPAPPAPLAPPALPAPAPAPLP